jgi:subtilisin family serine protease
VIDGFHRAVLVAAIVGALAAPAVARADEPSALQNPAPATGAAETGAPPTPTPTAVPGQIIVEWADGAGRHGKETAREDAEVIYQANLGDPSFQLVKTVEGQPVADAIAELEEAPAVALAEPDTYAAPAAAPNDPLFADQWALQNEGTGIEGFSGAVAGADINALGAWNVTVGDPSVVVADIDTGYRFDSPDLGPVAWENPGEIPGNGIDDDHNGYVDDVNGWDFIGENAEAPSEDDDPTDSNLISGGHGVHTAGIIGAAGNNEVGITGVAQNVRIMPLRVCANAPETNKALCPTSSLIAAINYAGRNGAKVANISLTGTTRSTAELNALAENPDTLYVAAAGNDTQDNDSHPHYPCNFDPDAETSIHGAEENVMCVAATDQADELASFSDWGDRNVDLGAPGTQILSTYPAEQSVIADDFQAEDFSFRWKPQFAIGVEGGFELTEEEPLTSLGISDSPGRAPVAGSTRASQLSSPVPVPAADGACTLTGLDAVKLAGGIAKIIIFKNGSSVHTFSLTETAGTAMVPFRTALMTDLAGGTIGMRVTYSAGPAPTPAAGMWLDTLKLSCAASLATKPTYAYLEGTSMAAPQVSGAAALLYSAKPGASTEEVAHAIDQGVDPLAALANKTMSGGRLDLLGALDWLSPAAPTLAIEPSSPGEATDLRLSGTITAGSRVALFENGTCQGSAAEVGSPAEFASPGFAAHVIHGSQTEFSAQVETRYSDSPCSEPVTYVNTVEPPPPAPLLDHTDPASPSEAEHPRVVGSAQAGTTIKIYFGRTCTGAPTATGTAAELAEPGLEVATIPGRTFDYSATATDAVGDASPCSNFVTYKRLRPDETAPDAPHLLSTTPASPAASANPRILGTAEAGSTIALYAGSDCSGTAVASGSAAELEAPGLEAAVAVGVTANFRATATDAAGNTSACSEAIAYTNSSPVVKKPVTEVTPEEGKPVVPTQPTNPGPTNPQPSGCTVPKLLGKTLGQAKAALKHAGCKLGKAKVRVRKGVHAVPVVSGSNPAPGTVTAGKVSVRLTPKPRKAAARAAAARKRAAQAKAQAAKAP